MNGNEKSYWKNESYRAYCPNIILSRDLMIGDTLGLGGIFRPLRIAPMRENTPNRQHGISCALR